MADVDLRLHVSFNYHITLPKLTPRSTMFLEQVVDARLVCECSEALRLVHRVLEVLGRADCSHEGESVCLPFVQLHREPHSVAVLDPAHCRLLSIEHEHGRRAHAMHPGTGRGIELVDQLRSLAEACLHITHLLRNAIDILHLESDVLMRSHLNDGHGVIWQMPERKDSVFE